MKNLTCYFFAIVLLCLPLSVRSADTININYGGFDRKYIQYKPAGLTAGNPVNLLFMMHGINQQITDFTTMMNNGINLDNMATAYNCIIVFPQALPEQNGIINTVYSGMSGSDLSAAWASNTGIAAEYFASMSFLLSSSLSADGKWIVVNKDVDDVAFINKIIADKKSEYNVNADSIFMAGISMGGSMTYRYAWDESCQLHAAAVISGYLGHAVDTTKPFNVPLVHFHSHSDEVVTYNGGLFNDSIPAVIDLVAAKNGHPAPVITDIPDTVNDGYTVKKHDYDTKEPQLTFYEITGSTHSTVLGLNSPSDINTLLVIMDFFMKERTSSALSIIESSVLKLYPNPAHDFVYMPETGDYQIADLSGKIVMSGNAEQGDKIAVGSLAKGIYTFVGNQLRCKLLIK